MVEVALVDSRPGPIAPQIFGHRAIPFPVVVNELVDVCCAIQRAEKEVMQHRIVQHHHPGLRQRPPVNLAVQLIVAQVIQRDVARGGALAPRCHAGAGPLAAPPRNPPRPCEPAAVARRYPTFMACGRFPNSAVPTRTMVAPSSMAASKSCDIPIESCGSPCSVANSRSLRKYGRDSSRSADHGGIVISPSSRRVRAIAHRRDQPRQFPRSRAGLGLFGRKLHLQQDIEGLPASFSRRASFGESTVWTH
jgi:hypothetical protein